MTTTTTTIPLFGGAIIALLPSDYSDMSNLRDVPSNQEIYLHNTGLTSIIIEILEYACPPDHPCTTDEEALKYHYNDMVEAGYTTSRADAEEVARFWGGGEISMPGVEVRAGDGEDARKGKEGVRVLGLLGTQTPVQEGKTAFTALLTTLVRLPGRETDVLITVSVPHAKGEYDEETVDLERGRWGPLIERGMQIRKDIWNSFEIRDWSLFSE